VLRILLEIRSVEIVSEGGESYILRCRDHRKLGKKSPLEIRVKGSDVKLSRLGVYPLKPIHLSEGRHLHRHESGLRRTALKRSHRFGIMTVVLLLCGSRVLADAGNHTKLPGRQVKVAAIAIGFGGDRNEKTRLAIEHLETAGTSGVDIACLPEEFAGTTAEPISGPTTKAVGELAKKHHMYVVCPIREQGADGRQYNTAVLLDRDGKVAGSYRKVFVFWGEGLHLSEEGIKVFDTDFGRIAMLTCFDANFDEVWAEAERKGAEIVFWPSAYGGGLPLYGYAMIHNYYVVAVGRGNMIDILGKTIENVQKPKAQQYIATIDLDRTLIHFDFTGNKVAKLLHDHKGEVELERSLEMEGWSLLRAVKPGVRVRDLCKQYQIETLREYRHRSREQINERRKKGERV
jgi:beta-ureidopropionase